jgi:hypothetical protein
MAIDFNTYSNQFFYKWQNLEFFIYDFIEYIMRKNQHGPISTIYVMTFGQKKIWHVALGIIFNEFFYWNLDLNHPLMIIQFKCIYIVTHGTIQNGHMVLGKKITYIGE